MNERLWAKAEGLENNDLNHWKMEDWPCLFFIFKRKEGFEKIPLTDCRDSDSPFSGYVFAGVAVC